MQRQSALKNFTGTKKTPAQAVAAGAFAPAVKRWARVFFYSANGKAAKQAVSLSSRREIYDSFRACDKEVLLLEAQLLAGFGRVVGIQDAGNVLHRVLFQYRE